MRKTYQMFLALVATMLLGAMNVNAEEISLQEVPFCSWEGWGLNARSTGTADCAWVIGEPSGLPYGDGSVINRADLSSYSKLVVTVADGTPRFLLNRDVDEGQWSDNEAESHLIDNTKGGWSSKYFSQDGNVYTVDLKQLVKDKGYAHLHAIKGANWADVTVESMVLEKAGNAAQVGWVNLINNSDMEGDDVSSFFTKVAKGAPQPSVITDGIGVNDSRGIKVEATAKESDAWDNQFWFRFNETVPAGTKYRVSFDYRADAAAKVSTQAHAEPSDYIHYEMLGDVNFTENWQTFTTEGEVTEQQAGPNGTGGLFTSIAFNLNELADANNYYFDNIVFEVFKLGTMVEFSNEAIKVDFGFDTNLPELVKKGGRPRLVYPNDCVTVTANGQEIGVFSVEAFADGRFYIFTEEALEDNAEVVVTFKNPKDAAYHITYTSGPSANTDVKDFTMTATFNAEMEYEYDDVYPYDLETPIVIAADPEDGSFNLPNSIKEFKLTFDKKVDAAALKATLNGKALSVVPNDGFAEEITLVRQGDEDLPTGKYTINVTKIYPSFRIDESVYGDTTYYIGIGKTEITDQPKDMLPDYFASTPANTIPEGWFVRFGSEDRPAQSSVGSGSRMFDFAAGGDFTKGLYFREGYAEYGSTEGYPLVLEAGKRYDISFNTAMWKSNGSKTRFEVYTAGADGQAIDPVFVKVVDNKPDVNGSTGAVNGSAQYTFQFTPEADGNYVLRWTSSGSETGDPAYMEIILAKPAMKYMPDAMGLEEILLLTTALENAKAARDENTGERYAGTAYETLVAAITKYEAEMDGYTAPSKFKNAAATLDEATQAVKDHRQNCDSYDENIKKAIDVVRQNAENKFANTELYNQLKGIVAKYNGSSEWVNEDPENPESAAVLVYTFDVLTDDAALTAAIDELKTIANTASLLFTEGASAPENANGGKGTGVAVLVERIRLGAQTLKDLGVADDDPLMVAANNALTDDGALANQIKSRIKELVYGELKNADNNLFPETVNEETGDVTKKSYDLTVFVKNPNIYKQLDNLNFTEENVPGWTTPEGYNKPGLTVGWGQPKGNTEIAEDCMFQTWGGSYRVEQTVENLPAGVYTLSAAFGERNTDVDLSETYFYGKTSSDEEIPVFAGEIGQAFPFVGGLGSLSIEGVVVTDGILTLGVNAGDGSHTFLNEVRIYLTAPADGFDYASAYEATGIETLDKSAAAKVNAIQLFDVNGRRLGKAQKGITIVKKVMSDGSIKTEKVIVK